MNTPTNETKTTSITSPDFFIKKFGKELPEGFQTSSIIFCYSKEVYHQLILAADKDKDGRPLVTSMDLGVNNSNPLHLVRKNEENNFAIIQPQAGSANIALLAEELYSMGFDWFLSVGPAGHVYDKKPTLKIGDLVIAHEALAYDATSPHYSETETSQYYSLVRSFNGLTQPGDVRPGGLAGMLKQKAVNEGIKLGKAKVATTGALYRETPDFVREVLNRGVEVVDMETSGLYSAMQKKEYAEATSLLYIVDRLSCNLNRPSWDLVFKSKEIKKAQQRAATLSLGLVAGWPYSK